MSDIFRVFFKVTLEVLSCENTCKNVSRGAVAFPHLSLNKIEFLPWICLVAAESHHRTSETGEVEWWKDLAVSFSPV